MHKRILAIASTALMLCGFATPGFSATGVQLDSSATTITRYNSITTFDPVTRVAKFYPTESLTAGALPNESWIKDTSAPVEFDAPTEQGIYNVCSNDCTATAPLVVSAVPGSPSAQTVVIVPDFTWQAYNPTGGGSLYGTGQFSSDGHRLFRLASTPSTHTASTLSRR